MQHVRGACGEIFARAGRHYAGAARVPVDKRWISSGEVAWLARSSVAHKIAPDPHGGCPARSSESRLNDGRGRDDAPASTACLCSSAAIGCSYGCLYQSGWCCIDPVGMMVVPPVAIVPFVMLVEVAFITPVGMILGPFGMVGPHPAAIVIVPPVSLVPIVIGTVGAPSVVVRQLSPDVGMVLQERLQSQDAFPATPCCKSGWDFARAAPSGRDVN